MVSQIKMPFEQSFLESRGGGGGGGGCGWHYRGKLIPETTEDTQALK